MDASDNLNYTLTSGKIDSTYYYTVVLNISQPGDVEGYFWVVDSRGATSNFIHINIEVIQVTGFEYQEKAPGETQFHALEDTHVVWKENTYRLRLTTNNRQINYDDPVDLQKFENLVDYRLEARQWNYNPTTGYTEPTGAWYNYNSISLPNGVYSLRVVVCKQGASTPMATFSHSDYYCFNEIAEVIWTNPNNPADDDLQIVVSDSGFRVYPEKPLNTTTGVVGPLKNAATITVKVDKPIPARLQGTVHIDWFDPDNPIGSTKTPSDSDNKAGSARDNHGTVVTLYPKILTFDQYSGVYGSAKLNIWAAHAGDNYIVAAHPNSEVLSRAKIDSSNNIAVPVATPESGAGSGGSGGSGEEEESVALTKSPVITVWRTLWAERDRMFLPPTEPGGEQTEASLPPIDGTVAMQLAAACVDLKEYLINESQDVLGEEERPVLSQEVWEHYASVRDSPKSSDTFWTVQMIGAFKHDDNNEEHEGEEGYEPTYLTGQYVFDDVFDESMVFIFLQTINELNGDNAEVARMRVVLHELGHVFGLEHATEQFTAPGQPNPEYNTVMRQGRHDYVLFSPLQLQTIQSRSRSE